jgi:hypothetical protein
LTWRELFSVIITEQQDTLAISAQPLPELLGVTLAELVLNFVLMKSKTEKTSEVGMTSFALINIHSLLPNVSIITSARDNQGNRLNRIGYSAMTAFEDVFSRKGEIFDFYTIGATVFGVRPIPEGGERISLSFIPYVEVNSLDETIPLSDDYRPHLEALLFSFIFARLGHFDRALLKLKEGIMGVTNVQRRLARP